MECRVCKGGIFIARNDGKNRTVVRNNTYKKNSISIRERHNERKNECYQNEDIDLSRSNLNVHFKKIDDTYLNYFNQLCETGDISTRGLKDDANIIDEMILDVNSLYFENNGGYDYAKNFFEQAYQFAVDEVGDEKYILSAVMHADEKNKALSEKLGKDVYHYHLHVTYIPVVEKEVRWSKRCKDKNLVGTVKEVIHQVSHSKKWASTKATDEQGKLIYSKNGKAKLIPSYSLLQDRFFNHMQSVGYKNIYRGQKGSTDKHLSDLEFKITQDKKRLQTIEVDINHYSKVLDNSKIEISNNEEKLKEVETKITSKYEELENVENSISVENNKLSEIEKTAKDKRYSSKKVDAIVGKQSLLDKSKVLIDNSDFKMLKDISKNYFIAFENYSSDNSKLIKLNNKCVDLENKNTELSEENTSLKDELAPFVSAKGQLERASQLAKIHNQENEIHKLHKFLE